MFSHFRSRGSPFLAIAGIRLVLWFVLIAYCLKTFFYLDKPHFIYVHKGSDFFYWTVFRLTCLQMYHYWYKLNLDTASIDRPQNPRPVSSLLFDTIIGTFECILCRKTIQICTHPTLSKWPSLDKRNIVMAGGCIASTPHNPSIYLQRALLVSQTCS